MLSGETSVGKYAIETVRTMSKIIEAVEADSVAVPPLTHVPRTRQVSSPSPPGISANESTQKRWPRSPTPVTPSAGLPAYTRTTIAGVHPHTKPSATSSP